MSKPGDEIPMLQPNEAGLIELLATIIYANVMKSTAEMLERENCTEKADILSGKHTVISL